MNILCRRTLSGCGDHCLMVNIRVVFVQFFGQALCLFLLEELRAGSDISGNARFPMDSVRLQATPFGDENRRAESANALFRRLTS